MKILFICTGNICRSAMAEGILKKLVKERNLNIEVSSAGICAETGTYATYYAISVAKNYDVDLSTHRATNLSEVKIEEIDLVLCMTKSHVQYILENIPNCSNKVFTLKDYVHMNKHSSDIMDPWGYDQSIYEHCISEINNCLEKLIQNIDKK